jgi:pyruvate,water dikinase
MTAGEKDIKVWYDGADGTVEVPVAPTLQRELCLTSTQVGELHELSERCRRVWGRDLDLEWALGPDGKMYLLQARPITTL